MAINQLNEMQIEGILTRDPEIRHITVKDTGEVITAASLRFANNRIKRGGKEHVNFLPAEVIGKEAEFCEKFLRKGDPVVIVGSIEQDRWEESNGDKRSKLFIKVRHVQGRGPRSDDEREPVAAGYAASDGAEDDIPF